MLVFGLTGKCCARALPAHIGLRCAQARPGRGPITLLFANRPSNFHNIDSSRKGVRSGGQAQKKFIVLQPLMAQQLE